MLLDPRNRFWSASSPLSSRGGKADARNSARTTSVAAVGLSNRQEDQARAASRNGMARDARDDNGEEEDAGVFRVPGPHDVPRHSRKNYERNSFEARNERNAATAGSLERNGQQSASSVAVPVAKPRIGQPGWRSISKTCDCIEKGKTSPVLRLADQARAVSSPDPLHRPDNPRASLRSAPTAQTLR